jgi:hypothetical protein
VLVPPLMSMATSQHYDGGLMLASSARRLRDLNTSSILDHHHHGFTSLLDMEKRNSRNRHAARVTAPPPQVQRSLAHEKTLGQVERSRAPQATPKLVVFNPHGSTAAKGAHGVSLSSRISPRASHRRPAATVSVSPTSTSSRPHRNFYVPAPLGGKSSYLNYYRGASPHMLSHLAGVERARADARVRRIRGW